MQVIETCCFEDFFNGYYSIIFFWNALLLLTVNGKGKRQCLDSFFDIII